MSLSSQEVNDMLSDWHRGLASFVTFPCAHFGLTDTLHDVLTTDLYSEELAIKAQEVLCLLRQRQHQEPRIGYVYLMQGGGYCKIGRSVNPGRRITQVSPVLPFDLTVTHLVCAYDHVNAELYFHDLFSHKRANGEWFVLDDHDIAVLDKHYGFIGVSDTAIEMEIAYQNMRARNICGEIGKARQGQGEFSVWLP